MTKLVHFFVYGTLKRGECREKCWPADPLQVRLGWTRGWLFDLGSYPAMVATESLPASDGKPATNTPLVAGEVWSFDAAEYDLVSRVLDEIEVTNQPGQANLYDRKLIDVISPSASQSILGGSQAVGSVAAETYFYANLGELATLVPVQSKVLHQGLWLAEWTTTR